MTLLLLGDGGGGGSLWLSCYLLAGVALAAQLARDAYARAALVCELYPSFPFGETLAEELLAHATRLPGTRRQVPTLALLLLYALALVVARLQLLERAWQLLLVVVRELPAWCASSTATVTSRLLNCVALMLWVDDRLPFLASEPEVPELLSEDEEEEEDAMAAPLAVNASECSRALEKLVQEKLRFAGHRVERPDGWLVFDPLAAELVPQKKEPQPRRAELLGPEQHQDASSTSYAEDQHQQQHHPAPPTAAPRAKTLEPHVLLRATN